VDSIPAGLLIKNMQESSFDATFLSDSQTSRNTPHLESSKTQLSFKKGKPSDINNYRPVSNLSSLAKLFELCILGCLEKLDLDSILGKGQHGFRKSHVTDTAITSSVISEIVSTLNDGNMALCYSGDLTAAFDLLRKEVLVDRVIKKDIPTYLVGIIFQYLSDTEGFVQIGNFRSCVRKIRVGCVQGSILSHFLFYLYTSELCKITTPIGIQ